jgi:hypothetical protein
MADARAVSITWLNSGPAMLYKWAEAVSTPIQSSELQRASLQNTEELVDGQWEPVGSAGGPGPWRDSAGVVTQLWESVVI